MWLLRIEDLDHVRCNQAAVDNIFHTLEKFGLEWDLSPTYQNTAEALQRYKEALREINQQELLFHCTCSRKVLKEQSHLVYPGTCRYRKTTNQSKNHNNAIRIIAPDEELSFTDRCKGYIQQNLAKEVGDFVVWRKDNIPSYQLAVVADDEQSGVTHVVRGMDLMDNTPRQIFLQKILGFKHPEYLHSPLLLGENNRKLSKQNGASAIITDTPEKTLYHLLQLLGLTPPAELNSASVKEQLDWGKQHWSLSNLSSLNAIHWSA